MSRASAAFGARSCSGTRASREKVESGPSCGPCRAERWARPGGELLERNVGVASAAGRSVGAAFELFGDSLNTADLHRIFKEVDENNSGVIEFAEFARMITRNMQQSSVASQVAFKRFEVHEAKFMHLHSIFDEFDMGTGTLSVRTLVQEAIVVLDELPNQRISHFSL